MVSTGAVEIATGAPGTPAPPPADTLEGGSYEVIRRRLLERAEELGRRAEALNARRKQVFGGTDLSLLENTRVRTENNCVPRDIVQVGGLILFGYNVFIGLKPETAVADVFGLYRFARDGEAFRFEQAEPAALPGLLADPGFARDFGEMCRYYR